jgi:small subunit ribosomal protein S8
MINDPLGDLLTRIRNGQMAKKSAVTCPSSKHRISVLEVLKREGYINNFTVADKGNGIAELTVELKYFEGKPVIQEMARISKPGRRIYTKVKDFPRVYNGLGISILSTPRGVLSDKEAREANVGGELLCKVF